MDDSTQSAGMPVKKDQFLAQLEHSYTIVRSIFSMSLQFITIAAAGEAASLTIGTDKKSALVLALGGIVIVALIYQLQNAGRSFTAAVVTALAVEHRLGLVGVHSLATAFFGGAYGLQKLEYLRRIALDQESQEDDNWVRHANRQALFRRGLVTYVGLALGIAQIGVAIYLYLAGYYEV